MEDFLNFLGIVMLVFGILQIILFFKVWGMTNNVANITRKYCGSTKLRDEKAYKIVAKMAMLDEKEKALEFLERCLEDKLDNMIFNLSTYEMQDGAERWKQDWQNALEEYEGMYKYFGESIPKKYADFTFEKYQSIYIEMMK